MTHQQFQMQPWHIFSGVFLAFWILMSYFDNFIITLILCVGAGFATDNLNQFMKGAGKKKRQNFLTSGSGGGTTNDFCPSKPLPPEPLIEDEDHSLKTRSYRAGYIISELVPGLHLRAPKHQCH